MNKKKKTPKAVRVPKKPISINIFLDGKPLYSSALSNMKNAMEEVGNNPFSL